ENRGGHLTEYEYRYDTPTEVWTLARGNGLQTLRLVETTNGNDRIVTQQMLNASSEVVSTTETTYRAYPWGEELHRVVQDPGGLGLTTTYSYHEDDQVAGSYTRKKEQVNPDGSWLRWTYDDEGRIQETLSPWLDTPAGSAAHLVRVTSNGYTAVDQNDPGAAVREFYQPRTVVEKIAGVVVGRTWSAHYLDGNSNRVEITERAASQNATYGDADNPRTVRTYYSGGVADDAAHFKLKSVVQPDGHMDSYTYESGQLTASTNPANSSFTPGTGSYTRTTIKHGTESSPDGIAYKTTRDVSISDPFGANIYSETSIYTGGYARISWRAIHLNQLGQVTNTVASDGSTASSDWACCGQIGETDAGGIKTEYLYDGLKRISEQIKKGVTAGAYPAQVDLMTSNTSDAGRSRRPAAGHPREARPPLR
ncbi:MAG: hypothetical protein AAF492_26490, partial [Verrucomicrobiota bacterium]